MNDTFRNITLKATGADDLFEIELIQNLWSGYGKIVRIGLEGDSNINQVVVKHVRLPEQDRHPRGWNTDLSHERKIKSYEVETAWYDKWSMHCNDACRVPKCLALGSLGDEVLMVLEDLNDAGYPERHSSVSWTEIKACLSWLAHFHATFMGEEPTGLWDQGTYWHLDTRPDELNVLDDIDLKRAAGLIDQKLRQSPYQTFVHGDAKLANFCFSSDGKRVAAVDFQYVGGGCGMKDLAYFIGSCLREEGCEQHESEILDIYFTHLKQELRNQKKPVKPEDVEQNWRELYSVAWTDFHRFLKGWSPGHWKLNSYSELLAKKVIKQLNCSQ